MPTVSDLQYLHKANVMDVTGKQSHILRNVGSTITFNLSKEVHVYIKLM